MTIRDSLYFTYGDKRSIDLGIMNVKVSSGMSEEPLSSSRSINEKSIRGRTKPYFQGIKREPLKFSVSFAFEDYFDKEKLREVVRWLTEQNHYVPLSFSDDNEKLYYSIVVDDPILIHNSLKQGYITLNFRCNDAYAYSPIYVKEYNATDSTITFVNEGVTHCTPEIWITKIGNGDFSLINTSDNDREFKFTGLLNNETVYVNNDREEIQTSLAVTYRTKDFNDNYLKLPVGFNHIRVTGTANIKIKYQFKL